MVCKRQEVIDSFKSGHIFDRNRTDYLIIYMIKIFFLLLCWSLPVALYKLLQSLKSESDLYVAGLMAVIFIIVCMVMGFMLSKMTVGLYIDIIDNRKNLEVYEVSCNIKNVYKAIKKCKGASWYACKLMEDSGILADGNGNCTVYYVEYDGAKTVINISENS